MTEGTHCRREKIGIPKKTEPMKQHLTNHKLAYIVVSF